MANIPKQQEFQNNKVNLDSIGLVYKLMTFSNKKWVEMAPKHKMQFLFIIF